VPNQEKKAEILAGSVRKIGITGAVLRLVKSLGFSAFLIVLALVFVWLGVPWYFCTLIFLLAVAIIALEIATIKKAAAVKLNASYEPVPAAIELEPEEHLVHTIPAVMQYGKTRSVAVLGSGQVLTPENALLITNKAIWALTVPLPGADKVVVGTDIGQWQWMYAWQDITDQLYEMLSSLPLEEVLKQGRGKRLLKLSELKEVKTLPFTFALRFIGCNGKKYGYSVRVKEDYQKAKEFFKYKMK